MKLKQPYVVAVIEKDPVEHLPVVIGAHEVPILALVHADRVTVDEEADLPKGLIEAEFDADDEYVRLEQRYGRDPDTKRTYVEMQYGNRTAFAKAMKAAQDEGDDEAATKPTRGKAKTVAGEG